MKRVEQWMAGVCLGILLIALGTLFFVKMGEEPETEQPREEIIRPPAAENIKQSSPQPPIGDDAVADLVANFRKHGLKRIGEALAKQPIDDIPADKQRLKELIAQIRKDYEERTARIRARAALPRKPLHGDGEPGNAWDFYRKALNEIRTMEIDENETLVLLADEKRSQQLTEVKRKALDQRGKNIVEKFRPILEGGLRGTLRIRADREVGRHEGTSRDFPSLMSSLYLQKLATQLIRVKAETGDLSGGTETLTDGLLFAQDLMKDGMLIDSMISVAIQRPLIEENLPMLLARADLSPDLLEKLSRDMHILVENQPSFFDTLDTEVAEWEFRTIEGVTGNKEDLDYLLSMKNIDAALRETGKIPHDDDILRLQIHFAAGILDRAAIIDMIRERRDLFVASYPAFHKFLVNESERVAEKGNFVDDFLPKSAVSIEFDIVTRNRATLESGQIAVAIKRYRLEQGGFPARVEDLYTRGYLPALPKDPFTGEGWKYAISPDGTAATVWSVGPNFRDDGGVDNRSAEKDDVPFTVR